MDPTSPLPTRTGYVEASDARSITLLGQPRLLLNPYALL